jgi:hypothetical protein
MNLVPAEPLAIELKAHAKGLVVIAQFGVAAVLVQPLASTADSKESLSIVKEPVGMVMVLPGAAQICAVAGVGV